MHAADGLGQHQCIEDGRLQLLWRPRDVQRHHTHPFCQPAQCLGVGVDVHKVLFGEGQRVAHVPLHVHLSEVSLKQVLPHGQPQQQLAGIAAPRALHLVGRATVTAREVVCQDLHIAQRGGLANQLPQAPSVDVG